MNYENAKFWFDIIQTLLIISVGISNFLWKRQAATTASIEKLEDDIGVSLENHAIDLATLKEKSNHHPTHENIKTEVAEIYRELRKMSETISEVNSNQKEMQGAFKQFVAGLHRNQS